MATIPTPVSPKVYAGARWAAYATLALTLLTAVTPDMLAFLGPYAPLVYGGVVGLTYALRAYLKPDPLRDYGAAVAAADADPLPPAGAAPLPIVVDPAPRHAAAPGSVTEG